MAVMSCLPLELGSQDKRDVHYAPAHVMADTGQGACRGRYGVFKW